MIMGLTRVVHSKRSDPGPIGPGSPSTPFLRGLFIHPLWGRNHASVNFCCFWSHPLPKRLQPFVVPCILGRFPTTGLPTFNSFDTDTQRLGSFRISPRECTPFPYPPQSQVDGRVVPLSTLLQSLQHVTCHPGSTQARMVLRSVVVPEGLMLEIVVLSPKLSDEVCPLQTSNHGRQVMWSVVVVVLDHKDTVSLDMRYCCPQVPAERVLVHRFLTDVLLPPCASRRRHTVVNDNPLNLARVCLLAHPSFTEGKGFRPITCRSDNGHWGWRPGSCLCPILGDTIARQLPVFIDRCGISGVLYQRRIVCQ